MAIIRRNPHENKKNEHNLKNIGEIIQHAKSNDISIMPFDIRNYIKLCTDIVINDEKMAEEHLSGYIEKRSSGYVMGINQYHSENRKRFTIAHELAHYLYDEDMLDKGKKHYEEIFFEPLFGKHLENVKTNLQRDGNFSNDQREQRANFFAASLLILEENLILELEKEKDIERLAEIFQVSPAAMYIRLKMRD